MSLFDIQQYIGILFKHTKVNFPERITSTWSLLLGPLFRLPRFVLFVFSTLSVPNAAGHGQFWEPREDIRHMGAKECKQVSVKTAQAAFLPFQ